MQKTKIIFLRVVKRPERKVLIRRGVKANDYWSYCAEVGCDVWDTLSAMPSLLGEPVCLWLPERLVEAGTGVYVQGVEEPCDFAGEIPDGFDVISLPESEYLMFQGEPFEEENFAEAIEEVHSAIERYDLSALGYCRDEDNPRIQLEPRGSRGYIEFLAIKPQVR